MAVTHRDVARLVAATAEPAASLVDWLRPDDVDMTGEPASFVELNVGRRLMVLAHSSGQCRWLDASLRCRVYAARPLDCRSYPFSIEPREDASSMALSLLSFVSCDPRDDVPADDAPGEAASALALTEQDTERWRELSEYQALVARWNRLARHRRRLGHRVRGAPEFLRFLGV